MKSNCMYFEAFSKLLFMYMDGVIVSDYSNGLEPFQAHPHKTQLVTHYLLHNLILGELTATFGPQK